MTLSTDDYKSCVSEYNDEPLSPPENLKLPPNNFVADCPPGSLADSQNSLICVEHEDCYIDNGGCDHICVPSGSFRICTCRKGYELFNETSCMDANECNDENGGCDQICVNTPGGHHCMCKKGFELEDDKKHCKGILLV